MIPYNFVKSNTKITDYFVITGWYVKDIFFNSKDETYIKINYNADFSVVGSYMSAQYLLGTGYTWKDSLKKLEIIIKNHSTFWIDDVLIGDNVNYKYEYIKDNEYKINISELEPNIKDEIKILFSKFPLYYQPPFNITG